MQSLNIVLSKVWLQQRLIGVKSVEEGDRISPGGGAIDCCRNTKLDSLGLPVIIIIFALGSKDSEG